MLGFASMAHAQTVTIKDRETGQPLPGVTLFSTSPKASAVTNTDGQADISPFKTSDSIEIRSLGYQTIEINYKEIVERGLILSLATQTMGLEEVVVSATRWKQSSSNIPSKVVVISPQELALQNPQTAADLLGISGKVFIQKSQQGGGSPMIRGFATNRLVYTVDGVRMNNAIFRGGNIQNVINLDPFAAESTEVLFGPGSVIYGSDAIGGVMSVQTLTPTLSASEKILLRGKALTRFSSANQEKTAHVDLNIGGKKWAWVGSFSSWDFDHLKQGKQGPADYLKSYHVQRQNGTDVLIAQSDPLLQIPSAYSQWNTMQKLRFQPNPNWNIQYGFHYSETSPYGRYDRHNRERNGTARYGEWSYGPQSWMMNHLKINHQQATLSYDQMSISLAQQSFGESRISRNLNSDTREVREEKVTAYSANIDFMKAIDKQHQLFYGVEFVQNDVHSKGLDENILTGENSAGASRYPKAQWYSIGLYINDELQLNERLTLQGGLRYNQFILNANFGQNQEFYPLPFDRASLNKNALTGSLGAVLRPTQHWVFKANFGTAFRSPNVDDIGKIFDSEPGAVVVPNPNLEAEYAYNLDIGVAKVWGSQFKIDFTAYYTLLNNALVRRDYSLNGEDSILYDGSLSKIQAIQNAAKANVYGVQAGMEWKFARHFTFSSDFNYQVGREELDDGSLSPSRHAAPIFGTTRLDFKAKKLEVQLNLQYQGQRKHKDLAVSERGKDEIYAKDDNGNTYAPAWYTLNLKANYTFKSKLSISAGLENMTNQRYRPYSSGISGAGRNFVLSARWEGVWGR